MVSIGQWQVIAVTVALVSFCVILHYEALGLTGRTIRSVEHPRRRMVVVIIAILITHLIEVWLFAIAYYFLVAVFQFGALNGLDANHIPDYVYYSMVVYTTLGFGDVIPSGAIRYMTGMEALTGLVFITWSASFAFIEMQRNWDL